MRRISVIMLTIASVLTMLACASHQTPTTGGRPRVGKPLVKRLPAKTERVELVGGTVRAKAGYQFVKQANGSVTVARMGGGGGPGLSGSWGCECVVAPSAGAAPASTCTVLIDKCTLSCVTTGCAGSCDLIVTIEGLKTPIIAY